MRLAKGISNSKGWRLSPAYDLNPVPVDIKPRVLSTAIDLDDATASLDLAMQVSTYFEIKLDEARQIAYEVGTAAKTWRTVAADMGLTSWEIERMASAFEHTDLQEALRDRKTDSVKKAKKVKRKK